MRSRSIAAAIVLAVIGAMPTAASGATEHAITGRLLSATGQPLGGKVVVITENRGLANDVFGSFAAVFSLGLSCAEGADPCRSSGSSSVTTDASGQFSFTPAQVAAAVGHSNGVILAAGDAASGGLTVRLNPSLGGDLGDLAFWDPHLEMGQDQGALHLGWSAPPSANSQTVVTGAVAWPTYGDWATIRATGVHGSVDLDPRAWEDKPARLSLTSGFHRSRANQSPRVDWLAPAVNLASVGIPISRGAPCSFAGVAPIQTCPLTDGNLLSVRPVPCSAAPCPAPTATVVDMRGLVHAGIVAARGAGIPTAAVSTDGQTWRSLVPTRTAGEWQAALFEANGPAWRYLRVDTGNSPLQLSQISVWPGAAPGPPPTVGADRGPAGLGNGALPASHGGHRSLAVWAVVAAILLVLVGAGLVRVRRQPAARAG